LDAYPRGLMGGALLEQVSFKRIENLTQENRPWVVLVLALDGLGFFDAHQLILDIEESIPRLTLLSEDACFCPLLSLNTL
ncbi:MAG TPA: hypothetical protein VJ436_13795, partial [Anaerolineales bacterium]|nr:hypothetical protein [Anaerolineales bacterium]